MTLLNKNLIVVIIIFVKLGICESQRLGLTSRFYSGIEYYRYNLADYIKGCFLSSNNFSITQHNLLCVSQFNIEYNHIVSTNNHINFQINKAFISYTVSNVLFKIGVDEIISGVGMVWNPSNVFHPVYSTVYTKEEYYKSQPKSIFLLETSLCIALKDKFLFTPKLIYLPSILQDIKFSKIVFMMNCNLLDYEISLINTLDINNLRQNYLSGYFRGTLPYLEYIFPYGEFQFIQDNKKSKWLVGCQIIPNFVSNIYLYLEYYKNSYGFNSYGSFKNYQSQNYIFPIVGDTLINYVSLGLVLYNLSFKFSVSTIFNFDDKSGLYRLFFSKKMTENSFIDISFYNLFYRDKVNEFYEGLKKENEILFGISSYFGR